MTGSKTPQNPQLTLELAGEPCFSVENFLISGSNEQAFDMITLWPDWPDATLLLTGPSGAGKSHLGAIWAERAGAIKLNGKGLSRADLNALSARKALLIENAEAIVSPEDKDDETALFHLLNLMRSSGTVLLLTAQAVPDNWGLKTPDLLSRLRLAPGVHLAPPDDALMRAVLVKLFFDRQLMVDTSLIEFAALRLNRSLDAAREFVAALDREALARGKRITKPMAQDVLSALEHGHNEGGI